MALTQITTGGVDDNINIDSNTLKVDGTNNRVGIGTAAPDYTLHAVGTIAARDSGTNTDIRLIPGSQQGSYSINANTAQHIFVSGANERMRIDGSGNLGIGDASPGEKLDVNGKIRSNHASDSRFLLRVNDVNKGGFQASTDAGVVIYGASSTNPIKFQTSGSEKARIDTSGRLLVGTTGNSGGKLFVAGGSGQSAGTEVDIARFFASTASSTNSGGLTIGGVWHNTDVNQRIAYLQSEQGSNPGNTARRLALNPGGGNVGIGTKSPEMDLDVKNGNNGNLKLGGSGSSATGLEITYSNSGNTTTFISQKYRSTSSDALIAIDTGTFTVSTGTSGTEALRVDSSGRLLLGTTSSTYNNAYLQVHGANSNTYISMTNTTAGDANGSGYNYIHFRRRQSGAEESSSARIGSAHDGTADDEKGRLMFFTNDGNDGNSPTERVRINSDGRVSMAHDGSYYNAGTTLSVSASSNGTVHVGRNTNSSFSADCIYYYVSRSSNSAFSYIKLAASAGSDNDFNLRGDGNAYADGSWSAGGADYAEYFEWSDGNTEAEDRRGISVVLDGDKIREAAAGEEPIGVISGNPSVVGDAAWNKWSEKYLRDDYGSYALDENGNRQLNPNFDPDVEYVPREDRPEWGCVGLMGKLRIRKGQVTGTRWIKMRDISTTVEEWLVR